MHPRRWIAVALLCFALLLAATAALFVWPASSHPGQVDAVVLFAGGRGERLDAASGLMDEEVAPVLVISNGNAPEWPQANVLCGRSEPYRVLCPDPEPDTTRGEARMAGSLAKGEEWHSVALVTSTYHATRAGLLLRRCFDGEVHVVGAAPRQSVLRTLQLAAFEWPATLRSWLIQRDC